MKYRFYKNELGWFIDIKWWPKRLVHHLAMVAGADILLDNLSNGKDEISISFSRKQNSKYPYYNKKLVRYQKLGLFNGAIYVPQNEKLVNEIDGGNWLWLCFVTIFVFGYYPKEIYYKVLNQGVDFSDTNNLISKMVNKTNEGRESLGINSYH